MARLQHQSFNLHRFPFASLPFQGSIVEQSIVLQALWNRMTRSNDHRMVGVRIRRARVSDLPVLVRHRHEMWMEAGTKAQKQRWDRDKGKYAPWARSQFRAGRFLGWVAETDNGVLAGSGCLWLRLGHRVAKSRTVQPYLLSMYTEKGFRGRGIASAIVESAIKWSKKKNFRTIFLHATTQGRRVYAKCGFKRTGEMRLDLTPR